jgi:NAD(P) transhydrogenase subunit alpha
MARQSSTLYSTNLFRLAEELCKTKDGIIDVNMEDEAIRGLTVIKEGNVTWPPPAPKLSAAPARQPAAKPVVAAKKSHGHGKGSARLRAPPWPCSLPLPQCSSASSAPARLRPSSVTSRSSCWPALSATWWSGMSSRPAHAADERHQCDQQHHRHWRPGADRAALDGSGSVVRTTGFAGWQSVAIVLATINMFGGFAVTQRMLAMFRK